MWEVARELERNHITLRLKALEGVCSEVVGSLLDAKADVRGKDAAGFEPIALAAKNGHAELVRTLLDARGYVDPKGPQGDTALMVAVQAGQMAAVEVLLEYGASIHHSNSLGQTAFTIAAECGHADVMRRVYDDHHYKEPVPFMKLHKVESYNNIQQEGS